MQNEIVKDLGSFTYADLTSEQLSKLKQVEDEINSAREHKVYVMALIK